MFVINIIKAVGDVLVSAACIAEFTYGSYLFQKWWVLLFALLPLLMYYSSGIIVLNGSSEDGGEQDGEA